MFVDVVATDPQGRPFNSLTEEDFQVVEKVDWATQIRGKITSFRAADNTARRRTETLETLRTPPATEKESVGVAEPGAPLTVLLLDNLNTDLFAPWVRQQIAGMADLGCDEHSKDPICVNLPIAVLLLGPKLEMLQDFSMDREALRATLHRLFSQMPVLKDPDSAKPESDGSAEDSAMLSPIRSWVRERRSGSVDDQRKQVTMDAIRAIARHLAGYPGRKKLIWVSSSFPFSIDPDPATNVVDDPLRYRSQPAIVMDALANARVSVYPARPGLFPRILAGKLAGQGGSPQVAAATAPVEASGAYFGATVPMEVVSGQTGGLACIDDRDIADCFDRVLGDGPVSYEIGYSAAEDRREGFHRVEVMAPRSVRLSYRRYYYVRGKRPSGADMELKQAACDDLMTATSLRLAAQLQTAPGEATKYALTVDGRLLAADPLEGNRARLGLRLDFAVCTFDAHGKPLQHRQYATQQGVSAEELKSVRSDGIRRLMEFQPAEDTASLRWVVRDWSTGNLGSIDLPYQAPQPAGAAGTAASGSTAERPDSVDASGASAKPASLPQQAGAPPPSTRGDADLPTIDPESEINPYCTAIARGVEYSPALAELCRFALSLPRRMPNVICDLETSRHWRAYNSAHRDVVTATVTYEDGQERYSNLKINNETAKTSSEALNSSWSMGEFASILEMLFSPLSDAQFRFSKEVKLNSAPALVFEFRVDQANNQLYYLHAFYPGGWGTTLFPAYHGKIWLNKSTFQLMRMEKETADIPESFPISRATTLIDYADTPLGDGSTFVLPGKSEIETCESGEFRECAHNVVRFRNWHKFRAKTRILTIGDPQ